MTSAGLPSSQDEGRETRYNPSQEEVKILAAYIDQYFEYPDRSDERYQLVDEVTNKLNQLSPHWKIRSVRLWFNNNKKYRTRAGNSQMSVRNGTNYVQIMPSNSSRSIVIAQPPAAEIPPDQMPPKKRPVLQRSMSVDALSPMQGFSPVARVPTPDDQTRLESQVTETLRNSFYSNWDNDLVFLRPSDSHSDYLSESFSQNNHNEDCSKIFCLRGFTLENKFQSIESCCFTDTGKPMIVRVNPEQTTRFLWSDDSEVDLPIQQVVSKIVYSDDSLFLSSGRSFYKFKNQELNNVRLDHKIACFSLFGSSVITSGQGFFSFISEDLQVVEKSEYRAMPTISSLLDVGDSHEMFAVASKNHNTIHVLESNLNPISLLTSHSGGISALSNLSKHCFISGGSDGLAFIWDSRMPTPASMLDRHFGNITMIYTKPETGSKLVITGSEDHCVRAHDIRMAGSVHTVASGEGVPVSAYFDGTDILVITKEIYETAAAGFRHPHDPNAVPCLEQISPFMLLRGSFQ